MIIAVAYDDVLYICCRSRHILTPATKTQDSLSARFTIGGQSQYLQSKGYPANVTRVVLINDHSTQDIISYDLWDYRLTTVQI